MVDSGDPDGSGSPASFDFTTSLPVTLSSFTARPAGKRAVKLEWTSTSEEAASHFDVQRSADGNVWNSIDRVGATNQERGELNYELMDDSPATGTNYYRLKMVDLDGTFAYSDVATAKVLGSEELLSIAPNPVANNQQLKVNLSDAWTLETSRASLHNLTGRTVAEWSQLGTFNQLDTPTNLPSGIYLFRVSDGEQEQTRRLVVR